MNWNSGFSATYYGTFVDAESWRDVERFELTQGSIQKTTESLRQSADIQCVRYDRSRERWIRIWLDARQGTTVEHVPLFTGLASAPSRDINGYYESNQIECYSVLKPAEDVLLERGWFAGEGMSGAHLVKNLLDVIPAPIVEGDNSPTLKENIIAENGENHLSMANKVLTAINWRLIIDGDGTVHIVPPTSTVGRMFSVLDNDTIEPQISMSDDWYACPNVFRAINGDNVGIARDDSEESRFSTVNRGREIWKEESNCNLNSGENITQYAQRRLKEEQDKVITVSYSRRFDPALNPTDVVRLHYPAQDLDGLYVIYSQGIELGHGARVSEEVVKI